MGLVPRAISLSAEPYAWKSTRTNDLVSSVRLLSVALCTFSSKIAQATTKEIISIETFHLFYVKFVVESFCQINHNAMEISYSILLHSGLQTVYWNNLWKLESLSHRWSLLLLMEDPFWSLSSFGVTPDMSLPILSFRLLTRQESLDHGCTSVHHRNLIDGCRDLPIHP